MRKIWFLLLLLVLYNYVFEDIDCHTLDDFNSISSKLPSSVDWRKKGLITPVKNQASCSTAWPVSVTNATESINQNNTGSLASL
ncbi:hypothetical protein FRX31_030275 [Thalictrum thalictroides]|uniref:Peptidase C1A papain C-terminal domain-containing protein n=1 Tax=Thalictrum thalictroides TaxID=46969 RepID=A0A7J6V581_THATH|nr:hypothetical protein FRX31_030275 [Thalictrum thalictroides]